jgi:3-isopropylmalate/(R)-2-methylmalate dehydratase small subunit
MEPFTQHTGKVTPLDRVDVDTDQIIPKQFLKRIERTGYGEFLFYDWRLGKDRSPDPDFVLNRPEYEGGTVLVAGRNFGCGSSREHAPWALMDYGFRAVISSSFADIFLNNCYQNGMLPIELEADEVAHVMTAALAGDGYEVTVDLQAQEVRDGGGWSASFPIDAFRRNCLLNGLDDIGLTLTLEGEIRAFEEARRS